MEPVTQFDAAPGSPLLPADYTVEWRGMSQDGHPMQGSFAFAVAD
jgi:methionine-rich copper-binding protein CopC